VEGQPPNVGYKWVNAIGSVGYIEEDRLYPVDATGHDFRFRSVMPDAEQRAVSLGGAETPNQSRRAPGRPPVLDLSRSDNGTGPWLLLKDPNRRRGEMLIMGLRPEMMHGEIFRFNRMITEDTALFDYAGDTYFGNLTGQIAVVVDPSFTLRTGPDTRRDWKVEPLGVLSGAEGDPGSKIPVVKFWGYCDPPPDLRLYAKPGTWPPCLEDLPTNP